MGDSIQRALEETVPLLRAAQRVRLLSAREIADVVRRRRDHEHAVAARAATRRDFLRYAAFERELAAVLAKRADKRKLAKPKTRQLLGQSAARVNLVYSRAVKRFRADHHLWLHYAKHCVNTGSHKAAAKVLATAIAYRPDASDVWLAAVAFHFDTCADAKSARAIAQRGLRALPHSLPMWTEYFRMELCYLAKLVSRRIAMALPLSGTAPEPSQPPEQQEQHANEPPPDQVAVNSAGHSPPSHPSSSGSENMSFWDGGIPMAVYTNACENLTLTPQHRVHFWHIVATTPYAPKQLLRSLASAMLKQHPHCIISRLVNIQLDWDLLHAHLIQESSPAEATHDNDNDDGNKEPDQQTKDMQHRLADHALETINKMQQLLSERPLAASIDTCKPAVQSFWENLIALISTCEQHQAATSLAKKVLVLIKSGKVFSGDFSSGGTEGPDGVDPKDPHTWSMNHFANMLESKTCPLSRKSHDVLTAKVLIPFRGRDEERALCAWLSSEGNLKQLQGICDTMLTLPPLTLKSLHSAIRSQMKIYDRMPSQGQLSGADVLQLPFQTRKLFKAATALQSANTNVDLWLDYLDFERRIARESKLATKVNWQALKTLDAKRGELFTERQMLRNLA